MYPKILLVIGVCCFSFISLSSQNLIHNPSFENYNCLGEGYSFRFHFPHWYPYEDNSARIPSDCEHLYHDSLPRLSFDTKGIPEPIDGEMIHSERAWTFSSPPGGKEIFHDALLFVGTLKHSLKEGQAYRVTFNLALAPNTGSTTDNIKVILTDSSVYDINVNDLKPRWDDIKPKEEIYQSPSGKYIDKWEEWTQFSDCFIAEGKPYKQIAWFFSIPHGKDDYKYFDKDQSNDHLSPYFFTDYKRFNLWLDAFSLKVMSFEERSFSVSYCDTRKEWRLDSTQVPRMEVMKLPAEYHWEDGTDGLIRSFNEAGTYQLEIETNCGIVPVRVEVEEKSCKEKVYIPNAFTPNNDGINDAFEIYGENITYKRLQIFNRYGQRVFESRDPTHKWKGRFNGKKLQAGVYVYLFEYINKQGELHQKQGTVSLLR